MNILVCISKTPDTTAKIAFTEGNTKFDENGVQWIINPYDEWYSLVRAIEIKEKDEAIIWYEKGMAAAKLAKEDHAYRELQGAYEDLMY